VYGVTVTRHKLQGQSNFMGTVRHSQRTVGKVHSGMKWPDQQELRRRKRRSEELELISVGIL
jgi:hypothetical protein